MILVALPTQWRLSSIWMFMATYELWMTLSRSALRGGGLKTRVDRIGFWMAVWSTVCRATSRRAVCPTFSRAPSRAPGGTILLALAGARTAATMQSVCTPAIVGLLVLRHDVGEGLLDDDGLLHERLWPS